MKIAIIGSGYVGLAQGMGCIELGHEVLFYDCNRARLDEIAGKQKVKVTDSIDYAIGGTELCFICVPTPYNNGIDLSAIHDVSQKIASMLDKYKKYYTVVVKSTVLPGTTESVVEPYFTERELDFGLCFNPEFLTQISTSWTDDACFKRDFWAKERIVIGETDKRSGDVLEELYKPMDVPIFRVDLKTAELCKYAANVMLMTKISYWNELFLLCNDLDIDCGKVAEITSLDSRIGKYGTVFGKAAGGFCLRKDLAALNHFIRDFYKGDIKETLLERVEMVNKFMSQEYGVRE
jgi:UDPglucose 6-dehydrogenase